MAPDNPDASWNPAFMPDHTAAPQSPAPPNADSDHSANHVAQESASPAADAAKQSPALLGQQETAADDGDAWFADDPADDWPSFEPESVPANDDETTAPAASQEVQAVDNEENGQIISTAPEPTAEPAAETATKVSGDDQAAGPALGHSSSVSFARTVSHEPNFHDDEESEFNLTRTDTDPFKFMPPTERTNSFPPVPLGNPPDDAPLPVHQAEDVMQEAESERLPDVNSSEAAGPSSHDAQEVKHTEIPTEPTFAGHDAFEQDEADTGSRFLEGVPLIPEASEEGHVTDAGRGQPGGAALFGDEPAGDDDFFSQVQGAEESVDAGESDQLSLQRTMQSLAEEHDEAGSAADANSVVGGAWVEEPGQETADDWLAAAGESEPTPTAAAPEDLAAKWQEAFAGDDDDDFLLEDAATGDDSKAVDPAAFFGSDDEGFLEDDDDDPSAASATAPAPAPSTQARYTPHQPSMPQPSAAPSASNPYAPQAQNMTAQPFSPAPLGTPFQPSQPYGAHPPAVQTPPVSAQYGAPPPRPEASKAQSFADKNKGGYTSPYDLPMEVVKPRKRASMQQLGGNAQAPGPAAPPPPRSSSMYAQGTSPTATAPPAPPPGNEVSGPPTGGKVTAPPSRSNSGFFEDLPMSNKVRPASRQGHAVPAPGQASPSGPPPATPYSSTAAPQPEPPVPEAGNMSRSASGEIPGLVTPPRTNPYASLQPQAQVPSNPPSNSRYSPAPPSHGAPLNGAAPRPGSASRYSPAPTGSRPPVASYNSMPPPPSTLPHLPRTSSPLAHFESSYDRAQSAPLPNGDAGQPGQPVAPPHEPRMHRVPSLPPTREVDEEEDATARTQQGAPLNSSSRSPSDSRYAPSSPPVPLQTPPPSTAAYSNSALSPSKRSASNYVPQQAPQQAGSRRASEQTYAPTQNQQTPYSPAELQGGYSAPSRAAHPPAGHPQQPPAATAPPAAPSRPTHRARAPSQSIQMVVPTDGREHDQLQRWKGAPIINWGINGKMVTFFPKDLPRYGMGQSAPTILRTPGEVRVQNVKDEQPLDETLSKFPGPLKGKAKKKETLAWLSSGIEVMEQGLPTHSAPNQLPHDDKRAAERVLLWKILRAFIEFDGVLEGNPQAEKVVRDILSPGLQGDNNGAPLYGSTGRAFEGSPTTQMQAEGVDAAAVEDIRKHLLVGEREKAVWAAADKRLWGHAMLISNTVSPELYKQVTQEFVRKEVNYAGHKNESMAALYKVLSGNHDDCVDELVPSHARAGMQLMNPTSAAGSVKDAMDGLDKWRETLSLVLSNRSVEDIRALNALGNLLSGYGRSEAAHICYLFSRKLTTVSGIDDPAAGFVLLGADHRIQADSFGKDSEALLLTEVYEYGLSLASGTAANLPHLAGYKLQHAIMLAEHGLRDKALQYCDMIMNAITAQTKRSPYYHHQLEAAVEDLMKRLKQSPKDESSSWISKPSLNNVSDSMWNKFNKFVAGDDEKEGAGMPTEGGGESGPFARIAGGTPTISPSPSVSNFDIYNSTSPGYPPAAPTRAGSRYAPGPSPSYAPTNMYEPNSSYPPTPSQPSSNYAPTSRVSNDYGRTSQESPRASMDSQPGLMMGGASLAAPYTPPGYGPAPDAPASQSPYQPMVPDTNVASAHQPRTASPYEPSVTQPRMELAPSPLMAETPNSNSTETGAGPTQGPQAPSFGYAPPSLVPNPTSEEQTIDEAGPEQTETTGGYEPPSFQPYGYEPPSYNPEPEAEDDEAPKPKKKSFMDDDDDDIPALRPQSQEKSKAEKDKENEEMFRKVAEEEAKRAAEQEKEKQAAKKGWGFGSWFGGSKEKSASPDPMQQANKPIKAKLGEASSFVYDPDLKRWVNKKAGADQTPASTPPPPPPKSAPRSNAGTPPPPMAGTPPPPPSSSMGPPPPGGGGPPRPSLGTAASDVTKLPSQDSLGPTSAGPPAMMRSASAITTAGGPPSRPPSRPATSMSTASSIDDLIGAAGPRKPGAKKSKRGGRYVDVMAK